MAITGNIATFYEDEQKTKPVFPITKTSAISNNNGKGLEAILSDMNQTIETNASRVKDIGDGRALYINYSTSPKAPLYFASWTSSNNLGSSNAAQMRDALGIIQASTSDPGANSSLTSGCLYLVYE